MLEVERKFIVPLEHHARFLDMIEHGAGENVTQAYIARDKEGTVARVRISKHRGGGSPASCKVTIKGPSPDGGLSRPEWEWPVLPHIAQDMIDTLKPPTLRKIRLVVPYMKANWEVDILTLEDGRHLIVAEVELPGKEQVMGVALPPWVGEEVTGAKHFSMANLTSTFSQENAWAIAYRNRT